jgi:hypothetical protein
MNRLKISIPIVQLLVGGFCFIVTANCHDDRSLCMIVYPIREFMIRLNYPVLIVVTPLLIGMERIHTTLGISSRVGHLLEITVGLVLIAASCILFWYFAVTELEYRRQGRSLWSSATGTAKLICPSVLLVAGIGAFTWLYMGTVRELLFRHNPLEILLNAGVLAAWGLLFLGVSTRDIWLLMKKRESVN